MHRIHKNVCTRHHNHNQFKVLVYVHFFLNNRAKWKVIFYKNPTVKKYQVLGSSQRCRLIDVVVPTLRSIMLFVRHFYFIFITQRPVFKKITRKQYYVWSSKSYVDDEWKKTQKKKVSVNLSKSSAYRYKT